MSDICPFWSRKDCRITVRLETKFVASTWLRQVWFFRRVAFRSQSGRWSVRRHNFYQLHCLKPLQRQVALKFISLEMVFSSCVLGLTVSPELSNSQNVTVSREANSSYITLTSLSLCTQIFCGICYELGNMTICYFRNLDLPPLHYHILSGSLLLNNRWKDHQGGVCNTG